MKKLSYILFFCLIGYGSQAQMEDPDPLNFMFSPNPVRTWMHLEVSIQVNVELVDIRGEIVIKETGFNSGDLNMSGLPQGIYFLRLYTEDQVQTSRIVKMNGEER